MAPFICTMDHPSVNVSNLKVKSIDLQRVNRINIVLFLKSYVFTTFIEKKNRVFFVCVCVCVCVCFFSKKERPESKN